MFCHLHILYFYCTYLLFSSLNVNLGVTKLLQWSHCTTIHVQVSYPHCQFCTIPRVGGSLFILFSSCGKIKMSFLKGRSSADEEHRRQIRKMFDKADKENIVKV